MQRLPARRVTRWMYCGVIIASAASVSSAQEHTPAPPSPSSETEVKFEVTSVKKSGPPGLTLPSPDGPSLNTALQEQLGLKLEATRGPVDVLVIDSVEQPTPD